MRCFRLSGVSISVAPGRGRRSSKRFVAAVAVEITPGDGLRLPATPVAAVDRCANAAEANAAEVVVADATGGSMRVISCDFGTILGRFLSSCATLSASRRLDSFNGRRRTCKPGTRGGMSPIPRTLPYQCCHVCLMRHLSRIVRARNAPSA